LFRFEAKLNKCFCLLFTSPGIDLKD
jgi:hypothetical protein